MRGEVLRLETAIVLISLALFLPSWGFAQPGNWSQRTARLLPAGRAEFMLVGPSRYAYQERVEVGISLAALLVLPNVQLKLAWPDQGAWAVASRHRLYMPGVARNLLAGDAPDARPRHVVVDSDLVMTRSIPDGWVTSQFGAAGVVCCEDDPRVMPTARLLEPRMPTTPGALDLAVRGGVIGRRFIGRQGWFMQGEAQVHVVPGERKTWLEIEATLGIERRHLFVQFGSRSSYDGQSLVTLPIMELGLAVE